MKYSIVYEVNEMLKQFRIFWNLMTIAGPPVCRVGPQGPQGPQLKPVWGVGPQGPQLGPFPEKKKSSFENHYVPVPFTFQYFIFNPYPSRSRTSFSKPTRTHTKVSWFYYVSVYPYPYPYQNIKEIIKCSRTNIF